MKILITADLHYDIARSRAPTEDLARRALDEGGDVLVLAGDTAGADLEAMRGALRLFADFPGRRVMVPGNHGLWCPAGGSSLDRYERVLPELAADEGFTMLDHQPIAVGGVGLVGSIGWYDYSFRDEALGIPQAFYEAKMTPGAARYYGLTELVDRHRDQLTERHLRMGVRWMDREHVNLPMTDEQFTQRLARQLSRQLEEMSGQVEQIVAVLHHLPFAELVPRHRPDRFAFAAAFLGARRLGEVLLDWPKVTHVFSGHSHWLARARVGHIEAVNVGSTYVEKRLEILELEVAE
jgi:predicted phosphohydrolase